MAMNLLSRSAEMKFYVIVRAPRDTEIDRIPASGTSYFYGISLRAKYSDACDEERISFRADREGM